MMRSAFLVSPIIALFLQPPTGLAGEILAPGRPVESSPPGHAIRISGLNTARVEYYAVKGDETASPYRSEGGQYFDTASLNLSADKSPFDTVNGQLSFLYNDSEYRSPDNGILIERFNVTREKGDFFLPYRAEVGDIYGYFTIFTLQRPLKGAQVDLQPQTSGPFRQSIMVTAGMNQPSWQHLNADENLTAGLSWLLDSARLGRYSLNYVNNSAKSDPALNTLRMTQNTISVSGRKDFAVAGQQLVLEGEGGHFFGDHSGLSGAESGQDRRDSGLTLQAVGEGRSAISYRLRYEMIGQDYRPSGAVVTPDRRTVEIHAGKRFAEGLTLRGRVQSFKDGYESDNPLETDTLGLNLAGPLPVAGLAASLDMFVQRASNGNGTTDSLIENCDLNLNMPLAAGLQGRAAIFLQQRESRVVDVADTSTQQIVLGINRPFVVAGARGDWGVGMTGRRSSNPDRADLFPTASLSASHGRHALNYSMAYGSQNWRDSALQDIATFTNNLVYRFTARADSISLELASELRAPAAAANTTSYRSALMWTHTLDFAAPQPGFSGPRAALPPPVLLRGLDLLLNIPPGSELAAAQAMTGRTAGRASLAEAGLTIYETRLLDDVDQRQRLVLIDNRAGRVLKSALIIDYADLGGPDDLMRTFEKIRATLIGKLGRTSRIIEEGTSAGNLAANLHDGKFIRMMEWNRADGLVRFGIPRRLDGRIRLEIQFGKELPPAKDTLWSIEEVR